MLQRMQAVAIVALLAVVAYQGWALSRGQRAQQAALLQLTESIVRIEQESAKGATLDDARRLTLAANLQPVVVETVPPAGDPQVDPALREIQVTFSAEMIDKSWSWSTTGRGEFPETTGKPRYLNDQRTCVLPVKLEPNKTYAIWLNSQKFGNFKGRHGRSAVPHLLQFTTHN